jgi:diacylglycerol kinase family enzyme
MIVALINPSACRTRGAEMAHVLAGSSPRIRLIVSDSATDVDTLIRGIDHDRTELLILAGGDGTLLNLLTRFDAADRLGDVPPLVVLPCGDMNTTARALVGLRRPEVLAPRIVHAWTRGVRRLHRLPVLRLSVEDQPTRVGLTVSLGAVARAHQDYEACRFKGPQGIVEVLCKFALQQIPSEHFRAIGGPLEIDGQPTDLSQVTAGVLSPLPGFFVGVRPFPRVRTVAHDGFYSAFSGLGAYATQASLMAIVRGRMPRGAKMRYGTHHEVVWRNGDKADHVAIDGELVALKPHAKVTVEQAGHVRMLVWRTMPSPLQTKD